MRRSSFLLFCTLLAGMLGSPRILHAQIVEHKLVASDGEEGDWFGRSLSASDDMVFVGALHQSNSMGAVYVFRQVDGLWIEEQKLTANDGEPFDRFGVSVSLFDDVAFIGADHDGVNGAVHVFRRLNGMWEEEAELHVDDFFGKYYAWTVSGSGDVVLVGAPPGLLPLPDAGAAYVFRRIDGEWEEEQKLTPSDSQVPQFFGYAVALSGETALVAAIYEGDGAGAVYVFRRSGGAWREEQKLLASDGEADDRFGSTISISGDVLLIGASGLNNSESSGAAYVFRRIDGVWIEEQKLTPSDGESGDNIGWSVSISGDLALVGAIGDDDNGSGSGSVYIFRRVDGTWIEEMKLVASDGEAGENLGYSVSQSGPLLYAGAPSDDENGDRSGSVYVFDGLPVGTEEPVQDVPSRIHLTSAYPNPIHDQAIVEFTIPARVHVALRVYDLLGREVDVLYDGVTAAGARNVSFDVTHLAPGVYLLRLEAGSAVATQRLTIIR